MCKKTKKKEEKNSEGVWQDRILGLFTHQRLNAFTTVLMGERGVG